MKKYQSMIFVLMILHFATASFAGNEDISCKDAVQTCPPTPNPCMCESAQPLYLWVPPLITIGSKVIASNGRAPYKFSVNWSTATITSEGIVTLLPCLLPDDPRDRTLIVYVEDACGNKTYKIVDFSNNGHWEVQYDNGSPAWPNNYIRQTITSELTMTTNYYTSCDCYYAQDMTWNPGGCQGGNYYSNDGNEPVDAVQYYTSQICGESPPNPYTSLEGSLYLIGVSEHPGWCYAMKNQVQIYGWASYCKDVNYGKVEEWTCQ